MSCQIMRVISSPSSSTTLPTTLILLISSPEKGAMGAETAFVSLAVSLKIMFEAENQLP
jgi:hypothetical protein